MRRPPIGVDGNASRADDAGQAITDHLAEGRRPVLSLIDLDGYRALQLMRDPTVVDSILHRQAQRIAATPGASPYHVGEDLFALVLPDLRRSPVVSRWPGPPALAARRLQGCTRRRMGDPDTGGHALRTLRSVSFDTAKLTPELPAEAREDRTAAATLDALCTSAHHADIEVIATGIQGPRELRDAKTQRMVVHGSKPRRATTLASRDRNPGSTHRRCRVTTSWASDRASGYGWGMAATTSKPAPVVEPETRPAPSTDDGDHDRFAHYVSRRELEKAQRTGKAVTALCGKRWKPNADPSRYPMCPTCSDLVAEMMANELRD